MEGQEGILAHSSGVLYPSPFLLSLRFPILIILHVFDQEPLFIHAHLLHQCAICGERIIAVLWAEEPGFDDIKPCFLKQTLTLMLVRLLKFII
jgi:hypothetical protein